MASFSALEGGEAQVRLDRYTEKAQEALQSGAREAQEHGQQAIEPEHVLLALLRQQGGIARPLLEAAGASIPGLEAALVSRIERFPSVSGETQPYLSQELGRVLDLAQKEADWRCGCVATGRSSSPLGSLRSGLATG